MFALIALLSAASAQDAYNAHGFNLVPGDGDFHDLLATWRAETQVPGSFGVEALFEYADTPVVQYTPRAAGGWSSRPVIEDLFGVNLGFNFALHERVGLAASLPAWLSVTDGQDVQTQALGDLRIAAPIGLVAPEGGAGVWASVVPFMNLPTGNEELFLGTDTVTGGGVLALSGGMARWQLSANVGAEWLPEIRVQNLRGGAFLRGAVGASTMLGDSLALRVESQINRGLADSELPVAETPADLIASLRGRQESGFSWTLGGGAGLTGGVGAAEYRAFAGAGWTLGKSAAPMPTSLTVLVRDEETGAPVTDAQVSVGSALYETDGEGKIFVTDLEPGALELAATAEDYAPEEESIELETGENHAIMNLDLLDGRLRIVALDQHGDPIPAMVRFLEGPEILEGARALGADGEESYDLDSGAWTVLIAPEDEELYAPVKREAVLDPGEKETIVAQFERPAFDYTAGLPTDVLFDFDKDTLKAEAWPILTDAANTFLNNPELGLIEVQGHADRAGSEVYNIDLSQRRSQRVYDALVMLGVPAERLTTRGYGEFVNKVATPDGQEHPLNRRVEFVPMTTAAR